MADAVAMKLAVSISAIVRARSAFLFMVLIVYGVLRGYEEHWGTLVPVTRVLFVLLCLSLRPR